MKVSNTIPLEITHVHERLSEQCGRLIVCVKHHGVDLRLDATSLFLDIKDFLQHRDCIFNETCSSWKRDKRCLYNCFNRSNEFCGKETSQ